MFTIRRAHERGHADHGWLNSYHTFSFAGYHDRDHMNFRALRVINEDRVAPGQGFGTHAHNDMEIVSYVLAGELEHKDSMGNGEILRPGEFQRITAGTGITHSEFNPSPDNPTHFYQIWLLPERKGIEPSYEQKRFEPSGRKNQLQLVASRDAKEGALLIHQDANIYLLDLEADQQISHEISADRHMWLQVLKGSLKINNQEIGAGDAVALSNESILELEGLTNSEAMLFDLA